MIDSYIAAGWAPVWIPALSKRPVHKDWPDRTYTALDFAPNDNVGIKLGDPSGGLVDVDLDCDEAIRLAPAFLPDTATFGRRSKRRSHWVYQSPGVKAWKPNRAKIELRSTGGQTVFPPSIHETGEPIEWTSGCPAVTVIDGTQLRACVARLGIAAKLRQLLEPLRGVGGVHDFLLALAGALRRSGWPLQDVLYLVEHAIGFDEPHREGCIRDTYAKDLADEATTGWPTLGHLVGPPDQKLLQRLAEDPALGYWTQAQPTTPAGLALSTVHETNDAGNAAHLVEHFGQDLRYARGLGWLRWTGSSWQLFDGPVNEIVEISRALIQAGVGMGGPAGKALADWGRQSGNDRKIKGAISVASHHPLIRVEPSELDRDPWLLNCPNGTVDLRTGALREHDRDDLITAVTSVPFDPDATAPRFARFISECMSGNTDLVLYLLRFLGYALTGSVQEHLLEVWHGPAGRNGKGALQRLLLAILGDYAGVVAPDLLVQQQGSQHPTGLLDLRGKRLMFSPEWPDGRRLNESLVKQLTGGDAIKGRLMRQDFVEFQPTHKLVVVGNYRPLVREQSEAFWARVHMLPWVVSFRGREDPELDATMLAEGPGVLRYLVAGCQAWLAQGKRTEPPAVMRAAVDQYRESQDTLGAFLAETVEQVQDAAVDRAQLYAAYRTWATANGEPYLSSARTFYRQLEERGLQQGRSTDRTRRRVFVGWRLKKPLAPTAVSG